jgi:hypothetical protein
MATAEQVCATLERVDFRYVVLTHTYQLPEDLAARLAYLEGFGEEVIRKLTALRRT